MVRELKLSKIDQEKLNGDHGPAVKMAMSILVRMAEVYQAESFLDITAAHIDSTLFMGASTLEFAERLVEFGARVVVPTTLNVSGVDEHNWQDWSVPEEWARNARRQMDAYRKMGTIPTWTCAPYQTEYRPKFGQQIAWGESNAIAFANSIIGARTERYPDLLDICAAITGRVPAAGLHLDKNRAGQVLLELTGVHTELQKDDTFYPVLGNLLGKLAGDNIPVINGLTITPTEDQLKALGAAAASSGAVALFHIVGVTPEAHTLDMAFHGKDPIITHQIDMHALKYSWEELTTSMGTRLDLVVLGSPHFSLAEFKSLAPLVLGKVKHPDVRLLITTSRAMKALAQSAGYLKPLMDFGTKFTVDTCILTTPMLPKSIKVLMTNSAKYAYYSPGLLNTEVVFGSLKDCIDSSVAGRIVRDNSWWED